MTNPGANIRAAITMEGGYLYMPFTALLSLPRPPTPFVAETPARLQGLQDPRRWTSTPYRICALHTSTKAGRETRENVSLWARADSFLHFPWLVAEALLHIH
ncbi:MAG: hypothetical protein IPH85_12465 [Ignavibacteria bacterium]|nr:hypothetical protein [Ignavibacteria bacterium]